jgi:hypothetical protein
MSDWSFVLQKPTLVFDMGGLAGAVGTGQKTTKGFQFKLYTWLLAIFAAE